jgi:hypothetical protein
MHFFALVVVGTLAPTFEVLESFSEFLDLSLPADSLLVLGRDYGHVRLSFLLPGRGYVRLSFLLPYYIAFTVFNLVLGLKNMREPQSGHRNLFFKSSDLIFFTQWKHL